MSADNEAFDMDVKVSMNNDVTTEIKTPDEEIDHPLQTNPPSNLYVVKRNFIHQLMDVALLMANVSQLKALLELGYKDKYYYLLLVTIIVSISLQVIFTICMLIIWSLEKGTVDNTPETLTEFTEKAGILKVSKVANALDKLGNVLVLCIIVANVFIVGFGVEPHGHVNSGANDTSA
ncbi:hypothetical protein CHS0354_017711 [Potamilus streckersoni]|uniref:Uncharacterized protein n=1 Tax=Potamilus streckersoni TaxID=2493646 RepID=A0AAE0VNS3_9BIVA|nr:hypothetical protein CHS0354_017711 [Potamilus streckersoni]